MHRDGPCGRSGSCVSSPSPPTRRGTLNWFPAARSTAMRTIDLRDYVVERWGDWVRDPRAFTPTLLRLDTTGDGLTLAGPLRVKVAVQARNLFLFPGTNRLGYQSKDLFCYVLEVPPGQTWSYPGPRRIRRPEWYELAAGPTLLASARYADTITATNIGTPWLGGSSTATIDQTNTGGGGHGEIHTVEGVGPVSIPLGGGTQGGTPPPGTPSTPTDPQVADPRPPV